VRGLAIWEALSGGGVAQDALALEAARLADRLDELDSVIQGKGVLNLMQFRVLDNTIDDGAQSVSVEVKFQNVLAEARQQQVAFAGIIAKLSAPAAKPATGAGKLPTGVTPLDRVRQKKRG
jgi:hypothetical protein